MTGPPPAHLSIGRQPGRHPVLSGRDAEENLTVEKTRVGVGTCVRVASGAEARGTVTIAPTRTKPCLRCRGDPAGSVASR